MTTQTPPRSTRRHLFQVLSVTIVPVALFAAGLFYLHWQAQERERERSQIQSARVLAAAVDNALDSTVQRMTIFARLWGSGQASDAVIHRQARELLAANPDWYTLAAYRADGTALFRADLAFDTPLEDMKLFDLWQPVIREQRPVVSDTFTSPSRGVKIASVGVPVVNGSKVVTHILIVNLNLRWYDEFLSRQGEQDGVAGIFDRNWKLVSRNADGEERRGSAPGGALLEDMKRSPEGIGRYADLDGTPAFTSWTSTHHGWRLALATPSAPIDRAFWYHLLLFGLLWAASVAAGVACAWRAAPPAAAITAEK